MHYLNTNALNMNGLLIAIRDFLDANGWAVASDGTGSGGLLLEMTNGNGHKFKLDGTSIVARTDFYSGVFNDQFLKVYSDKANVGLAAGYSAYYSETNDLQGPLPNVWLFTDDAASYCVVVAQTSNLRYTHLAFGDLDAKGLHAVNVPFNMGLYWQYWPDQANYSNSNGEGNPFNYPSASQHNVGMFLDDTGNINAHAFKVAIPDGLLDPGLFFLDGAFENAFCRYLCIRFYFRNVSGNTSAALLDFASTIKNHTYTGGVHIAPLPVMTIGTANNVHAYIGDVPGIGYVNMTGLAPGQILTFADEEWIVFPLKQYGSVDNCKYAASPLPVCNSAFYGIAVRKA